MKTLAFVAAAASALMLTGAAHAGSIVGLYNTGVTDAGVQAPNGVDGHWTLDGGSAFISGTQGVFPLNGPWLDENSDTASRWITPTDNAGDSVDPRNNGFYQYSLTFDLSAGQAADASFVGQFAADNGIQWIELNGNAILGSDGGAPIGGFSSWTNFAASSGFQAGQNTLTIDVINFGQETGNPSGLRVEFLNSSAAPEPTTWALMIGGFGLAGAALRRQRRQAVLAA
ncbi:PEPxxWA-CTERM sorting domain-containing protein [Phenylobacterium sp.]|uniref:PEPxxWA-CTERM sorting domain-containing protein n=1 Tax=Phenylobacterium sp. TaxID=1871053 RepID=UPI0025EF420D|nr:PEPxxWA-CTERM sorting domain-containing protein [Phenylobacterium sp.]